MPSQTDRLVVRQHDRFRCNIPARVVIEAAHADQVVLAKAAAEAGGGTSLRIVDSSRGGLGLESRVFLPKACRLRISVTDPSSGQEVTVTVRVQRVAMTDRRPLYYLGTAFVEMEPGVQQRFEAALAAARPLTAGSDGDKPGDGRRGAGHA
jgi:hypothetical protein